MNQRRHTVRRSRLYILTALILLCSSLFSIAASADESAYEPRAEHYHYHYQTSQTGSDTVTVLVYMNGSNLETEDYSATDDINEMLDAYYSDKVNVVIETLGTAEWADYYGIASDHAQRYKITHDGLTLVDDSLGQLRVSDKQNLTDFIKWGKANYPADRYMLVMWDHGGGLVGGFGYDENVDEDTAPSLDTDDFVSAVAESGVYFDFIGFDACLMSTFEVAYGLKDYCDYTVLSEDFESGYGWYYTPWLDELACNSSISTAELGSYIVDSMIDFDKNVEESGTLAVIDEGTIENFYQAWTAFAYANTNTLLSTNFSVEVENNGRALDDMKDYYLTDIMNLIDNINVESAETNALEDAWDKLIYYYDRTDDVDNLWGISVSLPYGNEDSYDVIAVYLFEFGIDADYIKWLGQFANLNAWDNFYNMVAAA